MREETEILSNTLKEMAKAILKDTEETGKLVDNKNKGWYLSMCRFKWNIVNTSQLHGCEAEMAAIKERWGTKTA